MDYEYVPVACVWELTLKCNMRCIHCGSTAGRPRDNELGIDECLKVADDLLEMGSRQITFIGGEVFLYPGWEKIARRLSDGGAQVNIITNAYHLGKDQMDQIKYAHLCNVGISLDGIGATHDQFRGKPGAFDKAVAAFKVG